MTPRHSSYRHTIVTSHVTRHQPSRPVLQPKVDDGIQVVSPSLNLCFSFSHARGIRKALKVADLKEILKKAVVSPPPKSTKADLIAKILAEPAAVDAYNVLHNPIGVTQQDTSKPKSVMRPDASVKPPVNPPVSPRKAQVR